MKIELFANYQELKEDAYLMDYTQATKSQQKVCIACTPPEDIAYFHLSNPRKVAYWAVNFEENAAVLKGSDQCECMFAASRATSKGWVCLVELKYCLEKNIERNSAHAFRQLHDTLEKLVEKEILDYHSHRIYLNISIPEHSNKAPFMAFLNSQDELLSILEEHKVKVLGYNKALILNEGFIKIPKEKI
ncbi:hypothetical protein AB9N12_16485 [Bacteroides sp. AN502(2024)]|uniref:hypothetical protein n=1 Tax=Bacteroides sp. AN502(2024) TaxID=3160599 RepID=UPI0035192178